MRRVRTVLELIFFEIIFFQEGCDNYRLFGRAGAPNNRLIVRMIRKYGKLPLYMPPCGVNDQTNVYCTCGGISQVKILST
jgi:hypothetical protein